MKWLVFFIFIGFKFNGIGQIRPLESRYIKPDKLSGIVKSIQHEAWCRPPNTSGPLEFNYKYQTFYDSLGLQSGLKSWDAKGRLTAHVKLYYNQDRTALIRSEYIPPTVKPVSYYNLPVDVWVSRQIKLRVDTVTNRIVSRLDYTSNGIPVRLREFGADTSIVIRTDLYDLHGNRVYKETVSESNFEIIIGKEYWTYTYDKNGNILVRLTSNESMVPYYDERFTYDEFNRKITRTLKSEYVNETISYVYNSYGDVIEETKVSDDPELGYICKTEYEYDDQGNWISKVVFIDGLDISKETRVIEYF